MKTALCLSWQAQGAMRHHDGLSRAGALSREPGMPRCLPGDGDHRCLSRRRWRAGSEPASTTIALATLLAAIISAEDPAERNDRQGTGLWLVQVLVGVARDLTSLCCGSLCLPRDILTLIPPPDSHGRYVAGTLMLSPRRTRSYGAIMNTHMTFGASWRLTGVLFAFRQRGCYGWASVGHIAAEKIDTVAERGTGMQ